MEKVPYPEHVHLGYNSKKLFAIKSASAISSPKVGNRPFDSGRNPAPELEFDFSDVFGGPPRAAATKESLSWLLEANCRDPPEKPVFGDESPARQRLVSEDFFNDIYGGESLASSRRKTEKVAFYSMPVSRTLSPNRPSSPKMPPLSPVPSLSSRKSQITELGKLAEPTPPRSPMCGSPDKHKSQLPSANWSPNWYRSQLPSANVVPHSPVFSISATKEQPYVHGINSRSLVQSVQGPQEPNDYRSSLQQSLLSKQHSLVGNGPSQSPKESVVGKPQDDVKADPALPSHASTNLHNSGQFHFSIHKWAGKGSTLFLPLKRRDGSSKEQNSKEEKPGKPQKMASQEIGTVAPNTSHNRSSSGIDVSSDLYSKTEVQPQHQEKIPQDDPCIASVENACKSVESISPVHLKEGLEFQVSKVPNLPRNDQEVSGKDASVVHEIDVAQKSVHSTKLSSGENIKYSLTVRFEDAEASRPSVDTTEPNSEARLDGNRVKGKVKEFIKIFNHEASQNPTPKTEGENERFLRKGLASSGAEAHQNAPGAETRPMKITKGLTDVTKAHVPVKLPCEQVFGLGCSRAEAQLSNLSLETSKETRTKVHGDTPAKICHTLEQEEDDNFDLQFTVHEIHSPLQERNISGLYATHDSSKVAHDLDGRSAGEDLQRTCRGELLSANQKSETLLTQPQDDLQYVDSKVKKWANGKEGNIRSLLSTLQYILWPESGWKPVPLVDIIEGNAVKRSYQKALLCLHPDKIQQKCGTPHQKYLAEKVFGVLQEAWTNFNIGGSF